MSITCDKVANGFRLGNDTFEAIISSSGDVIGVSRVAARGETKREAIELKERPLTLRLATDAPRIDVMSCPVSCAGGATRRRASLRER